MGAIGEHGDVDKLVFDAGAAAVVAPKKTTQGRGRASGRRSATGRVFRCRRFVSTSNPTVP